MSDEKSVKQIGAHVAGDMVQAFKEGAKVGASAEARVLMIDLFWAIMPEVNEGSVAVLVRQSKLFKLLEPVMASATIMFLTVFFGEYIPMADKLYHIAKLALVADGIAIVRPMVQKAREAVQKMIDKGVLVPVNNPVTEESPHS